MLKRTAENSNEIHLNCRSLNTISVELKHLVNDIGLNYIYEFTESPECKDAYADNFLENLARGQHMPSILMRDYNLNYWGPIRSLKKLQQNLSSKSTDN